MLRKWLREIHSHSPGGIILMLRCCEKNKQCLSLLKRTQRPHCLAAHEAPARRAHLNLYYPVFPLHHYRTKLLRGLCVCSGRAQNKNYQMGFYTESTDLQKSLRLQFKRRASPSFVSIAKDRISERISSFHISLI